MAAPGMASLVPTVALLIALPLYRIHQIPVLCPDFSFKEYAGAATPEERATLDLYQQANLKYKIAQDQKDDAAKQAAIAMIVKASRQKLLHPIEGQSPLGYVIQMLPFIAEDSEREGNLDAGLEQYLAAIRVAGNCANATVRAGMDIR